MKVLVIGSGGREHALVWKLSQSEKVRSICCAPGNAGIKKLANCVRIAADDIDGLLEFALKENFDLTVVGPENALAAGIVDRFAEKGLRIFGPNAAAAELESSKVFCKEFLKKHNIPSAEYQAFDKPGAAKKYIDEIGSPCVVKANGLAAGKGVVVCESVEEAKDTVDQMMKEGAFGEAGHSVVVEQFLTGEEASFIAFVDGETVLPLPSSQDHKAVFEGDRGPNTGGMGAYSPAPVMDDGMCMRVMNEVMLPTVRGMAEEGRPFKGMLYAGMMIDGDEINVLEFNCRFGDPECQPLLMRLQTDLVEILEKVIDGRLSEIELEIDPRAAVCVVMASEGYPGAYVTGKAISGLMNAGKLKDVMIFHAGTTIENRRTVTSGGRVLGVTALDSTINKAIERAYKAVDKIRWKGSYFRRDIGHRAISHMQKNTGPLVGVVMGSDSDLPVMKTATDFLNTMGIKNEVKIASAHRTPELAAEYARMAAHRGLKVIIAGAGMAAHLAGVLAAHTTLPVIGVPIDASSLNGLDALLSTVQMPPGIPVGTMGIGKAGAKNAAVFAARILAAHNPDLTAALEQYSREMAEQVEAKNQALAQG
ncbi:MAG: phosphoribosylamine--glycine ligase [Candidatus Electrothrix sp. YB6]